MSSLDGRGSREKDTRWREAYCAVQCGSRPNASKTFPDLALGQRSPAPTPTNRSDFWDSERRPRISSNRSDYTQDRHVPHIPPCFCCRRPRDGHYSRLTRRGKGPPHLTTALNLYSLQEWLPSLPLHLDIYASLNVAPPTFAHMPILLNPDGSKMSKRHGDVRVEDFIVGALLSSY